ncbi:MAG: alpha/beta fold hydrolase [Acidobacteriota bacterium]
MPESEIFHLTTNAGRPLVGTLDLPDGSGTHPTIVACHGFKGFMEWGFFPALAELLAARGFVVIRFNFTGSGMQPGDELVTDLEAFRNNTFSREVDETLEILDAAGDRLAPGRVDRQRIGLFGHSRGGGIALLAAADPAWSARLKALVTWAAVSGFDRASPAMKAYWRRTGVLPFLNLRTGQELPLGIGLLHDVEANEEALDLTRAAARRSTPWLVVHGDADETVPCEEGRRLHQAASPPAERHEVRGGDHGLGGKHPFQGSTPQLIQAMNATVSWYRRHLVP